jgi:uncharacterized protein YcbX
MRVRSLWQYPVKSMIGVEVTDVELSTSGVVGDRTWATRDLERGGIRGAKKIGGLMRLAARYTAEAGIGAEVAIRLPDGTEVTTSDPEVHERVSAALGHSVRLEALRPPDDLDHYRRGPADTDDLLAELRAVFGREDDEPLPDLGQFPPEILEFESPPGTYYDVHPLLVLTTSALRSLRDALPGSAIDVRRFRPSVVVDTGDEPGHPELGWTGRRARLGASEIELVGPCPRCVMVTREISDDLPADRAVLRHIVRDLDQCLGAYARVVVPGRVAVGDPVELV